MKMPNKMTEQKKKKELVINVPEMAEYSPPSSLHTTRTSIEPLRTNRTPNWDGVTGMKDLYIVML